MKKNLAILVAIFMVVGLLAACNGGGTTTPPPAQGGAAQPPAQDAAAQPPAQGGAAQPPAQGGAATEPPASGDRILRAAFVTQAMSNESQAFSWREFQRLAPEHGFEMSVFAGENEPAVEFEGVMTAIAEGFDAVFVNPSDYNAILPAMRQAHDAGLVVGFFSTIPEEEHHNFIHFFVGSDDFLGGVQAGEFVSQNFPGGANFVEVGGQAGHSAAMARHLGFQEGIADNIVMLDSQFAPTGWNTHEALAIMEDFIVRFGDQIDIVWCHWDNGASGVIDALQAAGRDDVFVIGVDGNRTGYAQVRAGTQALSVGQSFTNMADESLRLARIIIEGGTVQLENFIPLDMVTIETIDTFVEPDW